MRRYLLIVCVLWFGFLPGVLGQGNQVLNNGQSTGVVNFSGCVYNWTNDKPGIGLPANGSGDINSFKALNTGNTPVVATINATAIPVVNAYIASSDNPGTVSVINTSTNVVTATINIGNGPNAVSASPDGSRVYIANSSSNNVSVINTITNTVVATVTVGNMPYAISVSYDGSKVFVGNLNDGTVSVIGTTTNTVVATIPGFTQPMALTASPTGNLLYVVNGTTAIAVVNTTTNTIVKNITVGFSPWEIAISPDGTRVYVSNLNSNSVSVINAVTNTVIATIPVDMLPEGITVSPDGTLLYVGCFGANTVDMIATSSNVILRKFTASAPHGLSVTPDGKVLYVVNNNASGSVTAFNAASGATIATVSTGANPASFGNFIAGVSCSPVKFTITVNPTPAFTPTIMAGTATGTISACVGTASVSPQIQQIQVSGAAISGNITATAPAGFEISLSAGNGYGSSLTLVPAAGTVNTLIYVRSSATAAAGTITGNVTLAATGALTQNVAVTGFINALPAVNNVPDQYINSGSPTTAVTFAGTGNTFNWVNNTPGIGLAASGTGDIASFNAVNTGPNPVTATITATPVNANYAYVPDAFSNDVLLINTGTNTVVKTIAVGKYPTNVVLIHNKNVAYVSNSNDNTLSEINTTTNTVTATIPGFVYPWGLVASPDGNRLYVVNMNSSSISVLNTATNAVISTIPLSVKPYLLTISPDGSQLYLTNEYANDVSVISTATNAITATINVGNQPENMALNADGSLLYVANTVSKNISVINTKTNTVTATIPTSETIYNLLVSPDGSKLYMIGGNFTVVNAATYQTITTVPLTPSFSYGMSMTADGRLVYVANTSYATVSVVDTNTDAIIATINAGIYPIAEGGFVTQNATCPGPPVKFNITVYPAPAGPATITPGIASGTISACAGTASVSPQIQQFTVSGSSLTGNITATVTAGFELSLSTGSGFGNTLTIPAVAGVVNTVVYVRSAATAATGNINGTVTLASAGATTQFTAVNGIINALPTANAPANQTVNNGNPTTALNFSGTGNSLDWTNDTPSIGLAGSGTGDIPSFTAVNNGPNPVIATITATPKNAGFAYITNYGSNTVSVLSTSSNSVVATIPVDAGPWAVAVNAAGTRAYITNTIAGTVSVINTTTNAVIATITAGSNPDAICVSPDGSRVYVSNLNSTSVTVINTATNSVVSTISVVSGATGMTISPDGSKLYVISAANNQVIVINTATNAVIANIPIGTGGTGIAISPDGSRLYVANDVSNNVTIINALTNTAITTIVGGVNPFGVVVSPDGTRVYVTNENDTNITVIDATTNTVISNINAGPGFSGISMTSDGKDIFAVNGSDIVEDIDVSTGTVKSTYTVGNHPIGFGNFITKSGCTGVPVKTTITVNPAPSAPPAITPSAAIGSISACAGTASALPLIQQINIIGSDLTGDITATAPAGFEVSVNEFSGYSNTAVLTQFGGAVGSGIFVRSAATAPAGNISGNVTLTSPGAATQQVAVAGIVNAVPNVGTVSNQVYTTGSLTTGATFTGGASSFSWVNDTPGIGLAASGSGNIAPFTAVNNGSSPVVANITVTPVNSGAAYIPNYGDGTVSIINISTNTIEGKVNVGSNPTAVAVSPDGSKVFVANQNSNTISVIDVASGSLITAIPYGTSPNSMAITPDGSTIYITDHVSNALAVLSTTNYQVLTDIIVGLGDFGVVVNQDGSRVYVANSVGNSVSVINTANNTVVATIPVNGAPRGIAVSPDGSKLYVTNSGSNTVMVINTTTNNISAIITVGSSPDGVTVSSDGKFAYVANNGSATVSVINTITGVVTATIPVGAGPSGIALTQGSAYAYVTNMNDNTVSVINTATNKVIATVNVGSTPISFGNFIVPSNGCPGAPAKFTITVNPAAANVPTITAGTATGTISACAGTASVSPQLQQITVSGSNLIDNITASVPSFFEISTSPNSGFSGAVVLPQTGGNVSVTTLYIRSSASAPVGTASGYVTLSSTGWVGAGNGPQITETVNALPSVNPIANQTVNNGASTTAVAFSGTGNSFTWTNDTPAIGLPASGTGDIGSFKAINTGSSAVAATITVTPVKAPLAYITNSGSNTVSVINTVSNTVIASFATGKQPQSVCVSTDGLRLYVTNITDGSVSVFSAATNALIANVTIGTNPNAVAVSPDNTRVYVSSGNQVIVIDAQTDAVIKTINVGTLATGIAVSPDGKLIYAVCYAAEAVYVINSSTNAVVTIIPVGGSPYGVCFSPDGSRAYVTNEGSGTVSVINTATNSVSATINVGVDPIGIVVSPDGKQIYVANDGSTLVNVINAATNVITATITVGSNPFGLSLTPDGQFLYVSNDFSNNVSVISTTTNKVVSTIAVGTNPRSFGNFISGPGCPGLPVTFTITVNPSAAQPTITASNSTGSITACQGTASASPQLQQFTISGSNLSGDVTATAPAGFEIATSSTGVFSGTVALPQTGGTLSSTILYVRSGVSAPVGTTSAYITFSSSGWTQQGPGVQVTETVNTLPAGNPVSNQTVNNGALTTAVAFSGTGNSFTWTNDTPAIGLPASGTGDIASFTATNTGSSALVATISATPINGGFAYLTRNDGTVAVLSTTSGQVVSSVTVGQSPGGITMAAGGGTAYVANFGANTISVINTTTNKVTRTIPVTGGGPMGVAASKNGKFLYAADETGGQVSVINLASGTEVKAIPIGSNAFGVAISPDDSRVYATNFTGGLGFVSVINTATNTVIANVSTELYPTGVVVSPDGSRVYTANQVSGSISVINAATNTFLTSIKVGKGATGIAISPDGSKLYVSNSGDGSVSVINTATNTETLKIIVGSNPVGISLNADGSLVYVANTASQTLSVINTATNTVVNTISVANLSQSFGNFIKNGSGCQGAPVNFTITVNPSAAASPLITASGATGSISACAGTASVSPQVQQITISGSYLKSNITATAPSGFEISLSPNSGYASLLTINQAAGTVGNTVIYVRASATAPTGNISGNVTLQSFSATNQTVAVTGVVNALPNINVVSNQTLNNGQATAAVNFTGTGSFTWTNDTPGVGLAASGSGNIASFKTVNNGSTPVTATISVTAKSPGYAYITGGGTSGEVYVVNTATHAVVATVPVGSQPYAVAFSPAGDKVYVTNGLSDYVSVIDTKTRKVVDTMYVGPNSVAACISPDGNTLYVGYAHGIVVINTATGKQVTKIIDQSLLQIIISPDGQTIYAANYITDEVEVISTTTNTIVRRIGVGFNPGDLVLSPDGKTLYVTAMGNVRGIVAVVDLATSSLVSSIPLGARPDGITITPDGKKLYVTEEDSNKVAVINTATNQIVKTIAVGTYPIGVSLTGDGSEVYITNANSNDVSIINTATDQVVKTIPNISLPYEIGNFIAPTPNCESQPLKFTITVNPTPAQVPTITASTATGSIAACVGSASLSPQIQQFTVSGKFLAGDITATAPSGFEISLTPGSGYGPNVKLTQTSGTVGSTIIYVRSSASAPAGDLNGTVVLTTTTTTQFVDVHAIVNSLATVNPVPNQVVANGATTTAVNFGGTGNSFSWTNDTPGIGIAGSSTGDIPTFTARNSGTTPIVATFTVTPEKDALAYITSASDNNVSVINTVTNKIIATIPVGNFPFGTAASTDGRVYVSNLTSNSISVISTATNTVIATVPVPADPEGIAVSPDGNTVYVLGLATQVLSVIDTRTYTVTATVPVGRNTQYLALSPDGTKLFIANTAEFNLSVFDTKTNSITSTIPLTFPPYGIAAGTDNNTIYVDDSDNGQLVAVNASTKQVVASVAVGLEPRGITVSPDGSRVYVGNTGENTVSIINLSTSNVIATLRVGLAPQGMSVTGDGKYVYVASQDASNVSVINTSTNTVINTITVGSGPYSIGNFITPGTACPGPPATFTITVNPTPSTSPNITSTTATGTNTACQGTASVFPNVQIIQVSGANLTAAISLTAPNGFEISLSGTTGFSNSLTLTPVGGTVNSTAVYVRLAATAPAGSNSGNIEGTSPGARTIEIPVTGMVNALPTVNPLANQTVINGNTNTAVSFTGTGNVFNWTNDTPGIGLAASGTGGVPSFTAVNSGTTPVIAHITVTPTSAGFAYIANYGMGTVSVVNTGTNKVVATISVGKNPEDVAVTRDGSKVYVTDQMANSVSVIDATTNTVVATVGVGSQPEGIAVGPDGKFVYVSNTASNTVSVIDAGTNTVKATVNTGSNPQGIVVSPDGKYVYVANNLSSTITVINTATNTVASTINAIDRPHGVAISPDGSRLYVTDINASNIFVINTATGAVVSTIPVGQGPIGICVSPDGSTVYVADGSSNDIAVVNTATGAVTTIPTFTTPTGVSLNSDGSMLYVTEFGSQGLTVINTATGQIAAAIQVGLYPDSEGSFVSPGTGCAGAPTTYTITVNPTPSQTPGIDVTQATGSILTCEGTASASPNIEQLTVSGTALTAPIVLTAPNNFEISLSPGSGYTNTITLPLTGSSVNPATIYVRIASTSPAGNISGNVSLTSTGVLAKKVPVTATVNAAPTVRPVAPQTFNNGAATTAIIISGIATDFSWTNDTPAIGLPASGSGSINPFTAINTGTTPVIATITVTPNNSGTGCSGVPATFTITVDPTIPTIVASAVTGSISACAGNASVSPQLEQITVSGTNLTGNIAATAPANFEVSLSSGNGFGNSVAINQAGGNVSNVIVYVRSAAGAPAGPNSGNVVITSAGAAEQDVSVTATVNALPVVNPVNPQTAANGLLAAAIAFSGTATDFSWTNDTPAIGLPANGTGNITAFVAVNSSSIPIIATITVTPSNAGTGCAGAPVIFTITVDPTLPTAVSATGALTGLTTVYGTPSASESFTVSGTTLTSGILVTPPLGFELSTDNINFTGTVTVGGGGNVSPQNVYIRLAAITPVRSYSGNIKVTSPGATEFDLFMPLSTVTPALLAIAADDKSKIFNTPNPLLTASYIGFVNSETVADLVSPPVLTTTAVTTSPIGKYPITASGASSPNYTISYLDGTLTILPEEKSIFIPNTFTPNGDGINDTWNIKYLDTYVNCSVDIFTRWGQKIFTSTGYGIPWDGKYNGKTLPTGTYYYVINLKNGLDPLSGFVALIR